MLSDELCVEVLRRADALSLVNIRCASQHWRALTASNIVLADHAGVRAWTSHTYVHSPTGMDRIYGEARTVNEWRVVARLFGVAITHCTISSSPVRRGSFHQVAEGDTRLTDTVLLDIAKDLPNLTDLSLLITSPATYAVTAR